MLFITVFQILTVFFIGVANAGSVNYNDCGSKANITAIDVTGCTRQPCTFIKGNNYQIKIAAVGTSVARALPYKVTAKILLVTVTLLKGDACNELVEGTCPVQSGAEFAYEHNIQVKSKFPSVKTKVTAHVVDDKGDTVVCVEVGVKIKS